jgi:hypothetical protein
MRVEWLFFRWLLIIGLVALGAIYAQSWRGSRSQTHYETIPLVRGAHSSGMPVRGVMVDPDQRNIYAVVGGPTDSSKPADFFVLWKGKDGETFSATFPKGESDSAAVWEVTSDGKLRQLLDLGAGKQESRHVADNPVRASAEATLQTIVTSLSGQADGVERR